MFYLYILIIIDIYYLLYKKDEYNNYIISEIINNGLANRINCISSSLLISILSRRKLLSILCFYTNSISL